MIEIKNIAMTGSDVEEIIPATTNAFTIQAIGGDATIGIKGQTDTWTLVENRAENFPNRSMGDTVFVLNGDSDVVIQIWYELDIGKGMFGV